MFSYIYFNDVKFGICVHFQFVHYVNKKKVEKIFVHFFVDYTYVGSNIFDVCTFFIKFLQPV